MFICENCKCEYSVKYGSGRFCSSKCARNFSTKAKRKEINEKVSITIKARFRLINGDKKQKFCIICNKDITELNRKTCSDECFLIRKKEAAYNQMINGQAKAMGRKSVEAQKNSRRSKNEIYFYDLCNEYFKNVQHNEAIFNGWDADVIIHDIKYAILWNGKWHYEKISKQHSVKQVQNRDRIKIKEIENFGYTPYIIKDMGKHNKIFVEEKFKEFINSL